MASQPNSAAVQTVREATLLQGPASLVRLATRSHPTLCSQGFTELRNVNARLQQYYPVLFDRIASQV
jgi:hypothetical protein